jgi:two-component system phosphate regulon response regulator PhoB
VDWIHGSHSGEAICRAIRKSEITTRTYITVVLEPDCLHLRDRALDVGADSYIVRMPDRNAIIEGLLTRMLGDVEAPNRALTSGKLVVDEDRAKALFDGQHISMWPNELNLLRHFMKNRGKVFSRAQLVAALGKDDKTVDEKTIYRTISRLRIALRSVEAGEVIRTVRPLGYIMDE